MNTNFAQQLRTLMRRQHITQVQLAQTAGVSQPTISKYLTGQREPTATHLARIAEALHTNSEHLLGIDDPEGSSIPYNIIKTYCQRSAKLLTEQEVNDIIITLLTARTQAGPTTGCEQSNDNQSEGNS